MGTPAEIVGPTSRFYFAERLRLHYVDWGNESKPLLLLVHGGRDHARSWDWVARELRHDWHIVAPDLRGHGDSAWSIGSSYPLSDFVFDIAQLLEALDAHPATIIAHSLGGAITLQYAGAFPENVAKLVVIEGLGPPPEIIEKMRVPAWQRLRGWIEQMQNLAGRQPHRYPSIDAAAKRMLEENPFLSEEQARHLTIHAVARNEDGTYTWKFDQYMRIFPPFDMAQSDVEAMWAAITCPTLLMYGQDSWASNPEKDGRAKHFKTARVVSFKNAGHWLHHDQFEQFIAELRAFL